MTKEISLIKVWQTLVVTFITLALVAGVSVSARESREADRGSTDRISSPITPTPPPAPEPATSNNGGITSTTAGDVDTGGNTGGNVTTGDEYLEVIEINIGPTNSPSQDIDEEEDNAPPPEEETGCSTNLRSDRDCLNDNRGSGR